MNASAILQCVICQLFLVGGQLVLKHGMNAANLTPRLWSKVLFNIGLGIAAQAVWFFLWLGLLEKWDLSRIFPFEGLNPALMVLGAWLWLNEKLSVTAWMGVALICVGVTLVIGS